jgi:hypothetical protein
VVYGQSSKIIVRTSGALHFPLSIMGEDLYLGFCFGVEFFFVDPLRVTMAIFKAFFFMAFFTCRGIPILPSFVLIELGHR